MVTVGIATKQNMVQHNTYKNPHLVAVVAVEGILQLVPLLAEGPDHLTEKDNTEC